MRPGDLKAQIELVEPITDGYYISGGGVRGGVPGVYISCTVGTVGKDGEFEPVESWGLSRLEGEEEWTVDSCFGAKNCYPKWCHGRGSRCSDIRRKVVKHEPLVAQLNASAAKMAPVNEEVEVPDPNQGKLFGPRWAIKVRRCGKGGWVFLVNGGGTNRLKVHALSWSDRDAAQKLVDELMQRCMTGDEFKVVKF